MSRRAVTAAIVGVLLLAGCGVRRIEHGVYHSAKGYRVMIPGPDWQVVEDSRADLELQHRSGAAGMVVHATCDRAPRRRSPAGLDRQLVIGLRDRTVLERGETAVAGRPAAHSVLDARSGADGVPMRVEVYTLIGERCIWDLVYAAERDRFATWRGDFDWLVGSFGAE